MKLCEVGATRRLSGPLLPAGAWRTSRRSRPGGEALNACCPGSSSAGGAAGGGLRASRGGWRGVGRGRPGLQPLQLLPFPTQS